MSSDDFWIGDNVKILTTGEVGKIEGQVGDRTYKVWIKSRKEFVLTKADDLEKVEEKKIAKSISVENEKTTDVFASAYFNSTIDLHIDKLGNYHVGDWKADELSYQKHQCLKFLQKATRLKVRKVLIIHGKGEGVLRSTIEDVLHKFENVERTELVNNGGATEVWFRY